MRPTLKYLAAAFLIAFAAVSLSFAGPLDTIRSIDADEAAGRLNRPKAALYRLYAHVAPERLPTMAAREPRALAQGHEYEKCATHQMLSIRRALPLMDEAARAEAEELLGVPAERVAASPVPLAADKTVTHSLAYWLETSNFSIEWGQNLTNEDGTLPLRDDNLDSIPDVVQLWADYFENAYAEIRALGFTGAADLDTYKVKVYIANTDPYVTADNMNSGYYGVTNGALPHTHGTPPPTVTVNGNLAAIVALAPNDESSKGLLFGIRGAMMVTAAHELHHVFQFLYAPGSWANPDVENGIDWFMEGTSTWVEDEVYPFVNDYKQYYADGDGWQNFPWMTVAVNSLRSFTNGAVRTSRVYGSAIFPKYLSEHMGGPEIISEVWTGLGAGEQFAEAIAAAANSAAGTAGVWTIDDVFTGFAGANASMDYDDGYFYGISPRELSNSVEIYGSFLADHAMAADNAQTFSFPTPPPAGHAGVAIAVRRDDASDSFSLVVPSTSAQATVNAQAGETLTGIVAYPAVNPALASFSTGSTSDDTPPAKVTGLLLTPANSGFMASWQAGSDDNGLAGYVVQWKKPLEAKWTGRTIVGATITNALVRNLDGESSYDVRVFAYDASANRGVPSDAGETATLAATSYPAVAPVTLSSPWFERIAAKTVDPGAPLVFTVTAHDADGHTLEYAAIGMPTGASFNGTTRTFSWTPAASQSGGPYTVTFLASDGITNSSLKVDITVTGSGGGGGGSGGGGGGGCLIESLIR